MPIFNTQYSFPNQSFFYRGKVRDVYGIGDDLLVMVASDRISAFDCVLPEPIPFKGQILSETASFFLNATKHLVPNWLISQPHPNVTIGHKAEAFKVEMVVRGYLAGHAARLYHQGIRTICGVHLPEGLKENDQLPHPIITPTTKAAEGHDEDISREEIIAQGIVSESDYLILEKYSLQLFAYCTDYAKSRGLILVDTKYEFGKSSSGEIIVIDEIHTPDSSRYFYLEGYEERQANGEAQKQLSKEFVRQWLIDHDFMGKEGQSIPEMPQDFIELVTHRYQELFETITGKQFVPASQDHLHQDIEQSILNFLKTEA
jgi:phosphoribosylaminoimidazole-succinocarboxamide synthase